MPKIDYDNFRGTFGKAAEQLPQRFNVLPCGTSYAILSGSLAASASLFAKLAVDARTTELAARLQTLLLEGPMGLGSSTAAGATAGMSRTAADLLTRVAGVDLLHSTDGLAYTLRGTFLALIFLSNALMWALFSKALHKADSSITVTVYNTAVNFMMTAVLGHIAFNEPLSLRWWFGSSLILLGSVLMSQDAAPATPCTNSRNRNHLPPCRLNEKKSA
ncbi:hypothetical protein IWQ60_007882 [Tieghemiomyces parasiticus]|uniref:EamA domain-containing protein n=1 Tax=Tieghemiomyces parasiticus TaxID=78921 RepID=A0A9W8DSQ4_9FUNG|nr:hypothetical protein IWQ60_007882 [Tieghemiomyces parasiticus]